LTEHRFQFGSEILIVDIRRICSGFFSGLTKHAISFN
jgi:hypothetical protein